MKSKHHDGLFTLEYDRRIQCYRGVLQHEGREILVWVDRHHEQVQIGAIDGRLLINCSIRLERGTKVVDHMLRIRNLIVGESRDKRGLDLVWM